MPGIYEFYDLFDTTSWDAVAFGELLNCRNSSCEFYWHFAPDSYYADIVAMESLNRPWDARMQLNGSKLLIGCLP
jgi:hypothetical protein